MARHEQPTRRRQQHSGGAGAHPDSTMWMKMLVRPPVLDTYGAEAPKWLMGKNVRAGIREMFELKRYKEENERLNHEHTGMSSRFREMRGQLELTAPFARGR